MLTGSDAMNALTGGIIGAAIAVHRECGPGLLESVYAECLMFELQDGGWDVETGLRIPLVYRGRPLASHYHLDLRVNRQVIVEVKSVAALAPVHTAQLITYLKLTGCEVGLLINFNVPVLRAGVKRVFRSVTPERRT